MCPDDHRAQCYTCRLRSRLSSGVLWDGTGPFFRRLNETAPARGWGWGRHSANANGGRHPVVPNQFIPAVLVPSGASLKSFALSLLLDTSGSRG